MIRSWHFILTGFCQRRKASGQIFSEGFGKPERINLTVSQIFFKVNQYLIMR